MARCSSKGDAAALNPLSANANTFIQLFDHRHKMIQQSLTSARFKCNGVEQIKSLIGGIVFGGLLVFIVVCGSFIYFVQGNYLESFLIFCLIPVSTIALVILFIVLYKQEIADMNSSMKDFRKTVFSLIIELGKLIQRCEDIRGSLSGCDKDNLQRLETSVQELLTLMERLSETVTTDSVGKVYDEYLKIFSEFEKMKVRLSFYSSTKSQ